MAHAVSTNWYSPSQPIGMMFHTQKFSSSSQLLINPKMNKFIRIQFDLFTLSLQLRYSTK